MCMRRALLLIFLLVLAATGTTAYAQVPVQKDFGEIREERRELLKQAQERRQEAKEHVRQLRDQRKRQVITRIQQRINAVNKMRTKHFMIVLDRLVTILDKVQSHANRARARGKDVAGVEEAIAAARTAIESARRAVDEQRARSYQIVVNDESTARSDVDATVKNLHDDLQVVREQFIKPARDAVRAAVRQLKARAGVEKGTAETTPASVPQ